MTSSRTRAASRPSSPGAEFTSLDRVPLADGGFTDLSRYPARRGFEDLAMVVADDSLPFAWNAVTFAAEGYAWFAIRDPRVLRNTVLWISNGGRHYPPWNGRHVNVLGIEDVTAYFHDGVAASADGQPAQPGRAPDRGRARPASSRSRSTTSWASTPIPRASTRWSPSSRRRAGDSRPAVAGAASTVTVPIDLDFVTAPAGD